MIHPTPLTLPSSHALQLLRRVQQGISTIELVHTAHKHWPLRPGQTMHTRPVLRISILDSSFNPPTLAHLALANSLPPPSSQPAPLPSSYDARLLLLSVRNADKVLKPGDATFVQRLEMMRLLSYDIRDTDNTESDSESPETSANVAVAIIDEPTFVGKAALLLRFLHTRLATVVELKADSFDGTQTASCPTPSPKLTFLLGFDTLVRLFSPKYYPSKQAMVQMLRALLSPDREDCHIVCAYRGSNDPDKSIEVAHEFITSSRIAFIDIGTEEQTYSSSKVRAKVRAGDQTWKWFVTNAIAECIIEQGVYSNSERK